MIKKYWFIAGLLLVFAITVSDTTETVFGAGRWFKIHGGPDAVIVLIFFFSGLILDFRQIRSGLKDLEGTLIVGVIIFLVAPVIAACFGMVPLDTGIKIGLFLVAVMPTTLSSGDKIGIVFLLVVTFHGILLVAAGVFTRFFKIGIGRRESVIFMGGQKTLPLSVILQVSLFPQYGLALVVCVLHHMVHLLMDGYLVGKLRD